jgi:hypothetical protein
MLNTTYLGYANRDLSGMQFTTYDQDNDKKFTGNCASKYEAGWWHNWCYDACLNGPWAPGSWSWAWYPTVTSGTDIKETSMMIKVH